jgi:hypothetical protein
MIFQILDENEGVVSYLDDAAQKEFLQLDKECEESLTYSI